LNSPQDADRTAIFQDEETYLGEEAFFWFESGSQELFVELESGFARDGIMVESCLEDTGKGTGD